MSRRITPCCECKCWANYCSECVSLRRLAMFPVTLSTGCCADRQRRTDKMIMRLETKKGLKEEKYIKINDQSPSAMSRWNVGLCRHYPNANISGSCGARPTGKSKFGREKHTHAAATGVESRFSCVPTNYYLFPVT